MLLLGIPPKFISVFRYAVLLHERQQTFRHEPGPGQAESRPSVVLSKYYGWVDKSCFVSKNDGQNMAKHVSKYIRAMLLLTVSAKRWSQHRPKCRGQIFMDAWEKLKEIKDRAGFLGPGNSPASVRSKIAKLEILGLFWRMRGSRCWGMLGRSFFGRKVLIV